jgi:hypothetical protein
MPSERTHGKDGMKIEFPYWKNDVKNGQRKQKRDFGKCASPVKPTGIEN